MDNISIGKFIQQKRIAKHLTQNELGERLYVSGKAVSKWERGLCLPDVGLLEKLAEVLDTDIYEILQIKKKKDINIEKIVKVEQEKLKKQYRQKLIIVFVPIIVIILIPLFKLIPFGYNIDHIRYTHNTNKIINLAKPKFSFLTQNNENNFSYKNLRSQYVLQNEIKTYVNSLEHLNCNDTVYYYDKLTDTTIIDYSVKRHLLYNTISYAVRDGNYCDTIKFREYNKKLGGANKYFSLYTENNTNLRVYFYTTLNVANNTYTARNEVYYVENKKIQILESSRGTIEIKNDELIYTRLNINTKSQNLEIPKTSTFIIKNKKLILKDNYLEEYRKGITLS